MQETHKMKYYTTDWGRKNLNQYAAYSTKVTKTNVGIAEGLEALPNGRGIGSLIKI